MFPPVTAERDRASGPTARLVSTGFSRAQDVVYVALGVLLVASAAVLAVQGARDLARAARKGVDGRAIVTLLRRSGPR
jgi:hypothetical protein